MTPHPGLSSLPSVSQFRVNEKSVLISVFSLLSILGLPKADAQGNLKASIKGLEQAGIVIGSGVIVQADDDAPGEWTIGMGEMSGPVLPNLKITITKTTGQVFTLLVDGSGTAGYTYVLEGGETLLFEGISSNGTPPKDLVFLERVGGPGVYDYEEAEIEVTSAVLAVTFDGPPTVEYDHGTAQVEVEWTVLSQKNTEAFGVYAFHDSDPHSLVLMGTVPGAGETTTAMTYVEKFRSNKPGRRYFLVMEQEKGTDKLPQKTTMPYINARTNTSGEGVSSIVSLVVPERTDIPTEPLTVFPNPLNQGDNCTVQGLIGNGPCRLEIYDAMGRVIQQETIGDIPLNGTYSFPINGNIASGIYYVRGIGSEGSSQPGRIVIK